MASKSYTIFVDDNPRPHCRASRQELVALLRDLDYDPQTMLRTLSKRGRIVLRDDLSKLVVTNGASR